MRRFWALVLPCLLLLLPGCGAAAPEELTLFAMDTYMSFTAYGGGAKDALEEAAQRVNALEQLFSRTREDSDVSRLNREGGASLHPETAELLALSLSCAEATGGAFDVTVAPLVSLWNVTGDTPRVPSREEIDALLPLVGAAHLHLDGTSASLDEGCAVDLGGIAKGYASDQVAAIFAARGIRSGAVSLGGNVYVCGTRPDGTPWRVAVQDPQGEGYACILSLQDTFAVTSGAYQRNFTAPDGTVYHHILDPVTGAPAQSDLLSVTVLGASGSVADAYSTALFVMGQRQAEAFWRAQGGFSLVLITADGRVRCTPDLSEQLTLSEDTSYVLEIISP